MSAAVGLFAGRAGLGSHGGGRHHQDQEKKTKRNALHIVGGPKWGVPPPGFPDGAAQHLCRSGGLLVYTGPSG
jgi:hypothetical protein